MEKRQTCYYDRTVNITYFTKNFWNRITIFQLYKLGDLLFHVRAQFLHIVFQISKYVFSMHCMLPHKASYISEHSLYEHMYVSVYIINNRPKTNQNVGDYEKVDTLPPVVETRPL